MAAHAPITGASSRAYANVVRLPGSAPRKVKQNHNRMARAAKAAIPKHPAEHLFAGQRRALRLAERIGQIERTPALVIACALYASLGEEARRQVMLRLAPALAQESGPCREAVEMLLFSTMTVGQRVDFDWACDRLAGRR